MATAQDKNEQTQATQQSHWHHTPSVEHDHDSNKTKNSVVKFLKMPNFDLNLWVFLIAAAFVLVVGLASEKSASPPKHGE